MSEKYQKF